MGQQWIPVIDNRITSVCVNNLRKCRPWEAAQFFPKAVTGGFSGSNSSHQTINHGLKMTEVSSICTPDARV